MKSLQEEAHANIMEAAELSRHLKKAEAQLESAEELKQVEIKAIKDEQAVHQKGQDEGWMLAEDYLSTACRAEALRQQLEEDRE